MSVSAGCCGSFRVTKRMSLLGKGLCLVAFFKDIRRHCMSLIGSWPLSSEKDLTFVTRRLNKFRWETCVSVAYKNMILVLFYNLKDTTYSSCYLWCSSVELVSDRLAFIHRNLHIHLKQQSCFSATTECNTFELSGVQSATIKLPVRVSEQIESCSFENWLDRCCPLLVGSISYSYETIQNVNEAL